MEAVTVETGRLTLSGVVERPAGGEARGLIVALHGGGYTSGYWTNPVEGQSLLGLAASLGFAVLALDRPGYGQSRDADPASLGLERQAQDLFDAIEAWTGAEAFAGPVFVIGHSVGGILALMMAADPRGAMLAAVDVMGVPFRYPEGEEAPVRRFGRARRQSGAIDVPKEDLQRYLLFGPEGSYEPAAFAHHAGALSPISLAEYEDGMAAPALWPSLLPAIRIPVQVTAAEHEVMQCTGWPLLEEVRGWLHNSPGARVVLQHGSGHNVSLHKVARAYHLRAIAFFEEALALR